MSKSQAIAGLDLGSGKITCVLAVPSEKNGEFEILNGAVIACKGLRGGVILNLQDTSAAIRQVIDKLEEESGEEVRGVFLALRGDHIISLNSQFEKRIQRSDKEINKEDVEEVIENAKPIRLDNDQEIIHTIPQEFSLDSQQGVPNPVGMEGNILGVNVHIVKASSTLLGNISKAVANAGFQIDEPVYGLLAAGDIVLTQEEKEIGCLLIDFSGLSTGVAVYKDGKIRYSKEFHLFGSDHITQDIAHALKTSFATAQKIKENYGLAMTELISEDNVFDYTRVDGHNVLKATKKQLVEIIQTRIDQMLYAIEEDLKTSSDPTMFEAGGVIITGGGSKLEGLVRAVEKTFGTYARKGRVIDMNGPESIIEDAVFVTAIGLFKTDLTPRFAPKKYSRIGSGGSLFVKIRRWIEDTF